MSGRVAIAFPLPLEREHIGKDVFLIAEGLRRLGHPVELHAPSAVPGDWPLPVIEAGRDGLERADHWAGRDLAGAVVFSFLRHSRVLAALRATGARVVAKGDTTGHVVVRAHPRRTLEYALLDPPTARRRAVSVAYWLARMGPLHRREATELARALDAAHVTVVETQGAKLAATAALERLGAGALAERLVVVPNPVGELFLRGEVAADREPLLVAVGRWDLRVKDAPLLAGALGRFLASHTDHRAVVVGRGDVPALAARGRLERAGVLPREQLVGLLGRARIVASSSHWESFSLSAYEGLAMGCTVAGPALAPLREATAQGPFGTIAARRDAEGLASALAAEAAAWERGERDPVAGAAYWRARVDGDAIARRYAELLELRGGSASARS